MHFNVKNLTNQRFGRLTALSYVKREGRTLAFWLCRCDCGKEKIVGGLVLRNGRTKSCGCLQKDTVSKLSSLPPGQASFNKLYGKYKRRAIKGGRAFDLSEDDFRKITKELCTYCGSPPMHEAYNKNMNESYIYNGIDRIDNKLGYVKDNYVSCCGTCNFLKHSLGINKFLSHIKKIYEYRGLNVWK